MSIIQEITTWISLHYLELAGTLSGIAGVLLTARQIIWCWPVNMISVCSYMVVFYKAEYYLLSGLQVFYLVLVIYGWFHWKYGAGEKKKLPVTTMRLRLFILVMLVIAAGGAATGMLMAKYAETDTPYLEAYLTVSSIASTWLGARKILENWLIWLVIDTAFVITFIRDEMYPTVVLYVFYIILAIYGFSEWRTDYRKNMGRCVSP